MWGQIIAIVVLLLILATFYLVYRDASACHKGKGGLLCKLWSWLA
jgi:hypothetical protein